MFVPGPRRRERTIEKDAKHPCPLPEAGPRSEAAPSVPPQVMQRGGTRGMDQAEKASPAAILAVVSSTRERNHALRLFSAVLAAFALFFFDCSSR